VGRAFDKRGKRDGNKTKSAQKTERGKKLLNGENSGVGKKGRPLGGGMMTAWSTRDCTFTGS